MDKNKDLITGRLLVCKKDLFITDGIKFIKNQFNWIKIGIEDSEQRSIYIESNYATKREIMSGSYGLWFEINQIGADYYIWNYFETLIDSRKRKIKQIRIHEENFNSR